VSGDDHHRGRQLERSMAEIGDPKPVMIDEDEAENEAYRKAVDEGIAAADRGDVVPHERVRRWLLQIARGEFRVPLPDAEDR
jgi:predicted transcriptional regulator